MTAVQFRRLAPDAVGSGRLDGETYRSHLEADGPGMHRDLALAQVTQARGPLLFDSESTIPEKCTQACASYVIWRPTASVCDADNGVSNDMIFRVRTKADLSCEDES